MDIKGAILLKIVAYSRRKQVVISHSMRDRNLRMKATTTTLLIIDKIRGRIHLYLLH